jgi:hypothetical protein
MAGVGAAAQARKARKARSGNRDRERRRRDAETTGQRAEETRRAARHARPDPKPASPKRSSAAGTPKPNTTTQAPNATSAPGHADTTSRGVEDAAQTPRRMPHTCHAGVPRSQPRSLTDTSPPMTRTGVRTGQPPGQGTELPSWSCGFDSRHPLHQLSCIFERFGLTSRVPVPAACSIA